MYVYTRMDIITCPTVSIEQQLSASAIKEKYGIDCRRIKSGCAECYRISKSEFVTVSTARIPYYLHNWPAPGKNVAMIDTNSKSPVELYYVYDHASLRRKVGILVLGVKFNVLPTY